MYIDIAHNAIFISIYMIDMDTYIWREGEGGKRMKLDNFLPCSKI